MILGFKEKFPWGESSNFREKILAGVRKSSITMYAAKARRMQADSSFAMAIEPLSFTPKIHTMRTDAHDRWKAGCSIQMVYRGPKYSIKDHFNKDIPELGKCISTQKVKIEWFTVLLDNQRK